MGFGDYFTIKGNEAAVEEVKPIIEGGTTIEPETIAPVEVVPEVVAPEAVVINESIETAPTVTEELDLDESKILQSLNKKYGKEFTSLDEFTAPKEVVKEINPYEGIGDEAAQFLKYTKETGRGLQDWQLLNTDLNTVDPLVFARERVRQETGQLDMDNELADRYIANKLAIDLSDPTDIDELAKLDLIAYGKIIKDQRIADKETYKTPIVKTEQAPSPSDDVVQLDNGTLMNKVAYEQMVQEHQAHIDQVKAAANSVTEASFKIAVDDNGTTKEYALNYEYSTDDVQRMASYASDPSKAAEKLFRSEQGFDYKNFNESVLWLDKNFREKAIVSLVQKAIAQNTEEMVKRDNNVNFSTGGLQNNGLAKKVVPLPSTTQTAGGFGKLFQQQS